MGRRGIAGWLCVACAVTSGCVGRTGFSDDSDVDCRGTPHASVACIDDLIWLDSCGRPEEVFEDCGGQGCTADGCLAERWFSLGDSVPGDWSETLTNSAGGISSTAGDSWSPWLTRAPDDMPMVVWQDASSGVWQIYTRKYDGAAWVEVSPDSATAGGLSDTSGSSGLPSLAFDAVGRPVVAWTDESPNSQILVRRLEGNAWVGLAGSGQSPGVSNTPRLSGQPHMCVDALGAPVVVWIDGPSSERDPYIRRFDGSAWVEVPPGSGSASGGGLIDSTGASYQPFVAAHGSGDLTLAFANDEAGNFEIFVMRYVGGTWQGQSTASGGGISDNAGDSISPAIVVDPQDRPVVAWSDDSSGTAQIYARRLEGGVWVPMGSGAATAGGISATAGASTQPTLGVGGDGDIYLAWSDDTSGNAEIYLVRFDGSEWVENPSGSATGGGLSNSTATSTQPRITPYRRSACVAWAEGAGGSRDILLRCGR